jgi:hypothetical protein
MPFLELTDAPASNGNTELLLLALEEVGGGREVSINDCVPFARSALFPTSSSVKFGDARARASFKKVGRDVNVGYDVMS